MIRLGQPGQTLPGEGEFDRPATVAILVVVEGAVDGDGGAFAGKCPLELAEAAAARVIRKTDSVERLQLRAGKLRRGGEAPRLVGLVPNKERFVAGIETVDLAFIIGIAL